MTRCSTATHLPPLLLLLSRRQQPWRSRATAATINFNHHFLHISSSPSSFFITATAVNSKNINNCNNFGISKNSGFFPTPSKNCAIKQQSRRLLQSSSSASTPQQTTAKKMPSQEPTKNGCLQSKKVLTMDSINPNVKTMEYAVRGPIVIRAVEIENSMIQGTKYPFPNVIKANIGDAQAMSQQYITFIRQVIACTTCPSLIKSSEFPEDVKTRAAEILKACGGGSVGAYSQSTGIDLIRKHVAEYIERRDGIPCDFNNVCLFGGASEAIRSVLKLFINRNDAKKTGVMIPIPQYPLYSASIEEYNLGQVGYYLDEEKNWALDLDELERAYQEGNKEFNVKCIVVINPGNPTGQVLSLENIQSIIKFAQKHNLFLLADEVYQENVYDEKSKFHSFKRVMAQMGPPYSDLEMASFYSCSKGYMGECGLRGGYVEFVNLDPAVYVEFKKMVSAKLCSTIVGQITMDCVVKHPQPGEPSFEKWKNEKASVLNSLKEKAKMVTTAYNEIEGVSLQNVQGAMYAFPKITLPQRFIEEAKKQKVEPDFLYCLKLLESTGICVVPGSGFGQRPGTYHFRTTILPPTQLFGDMIERYKIFHSNFVKQYS